MALVVLLASASLFGCYYRFTIEDLNESSKNATPQDPILKSTKVSGGGFVAGGDQYANGDPW
jgi:hypothetical protein